MLLPPPTGTHVYAFAMSVYSTHPVQSLVLLHDTGLKVPGGPVAGEHVLVCTGLTVPPSGFIGGGTGFVVVCFGAFRWASTNVMVSPAASTTTAHAMDTPTS